MEETLIPKRIVAVIANENIRKVVAATDLYSRLAMAGHQIVGVFDDYQTALVEMKKGNIDADMLLFDSPENREGKEDPERARIQEEEKAKCIAMLEEFDKVHQNPTERDYYYESSKITVILGHFSMNFRDSRYREELRNTGYSTVFHMSVDDDFRSETRRTDLLIDPYEARDVDYLNRMIYKIGLLRLGEHQFRKRDELSDVVKREGKVRSEDSTDVFDR